MGASWKTSLIGWILIVGDGVAFIVDVIVKQGLPDTLIEWLLFGSVLATGIGKLFTKDYDVSNAPSPTAATVVSAASEAKTNPAAAKP